MKGAKIIYEQLGGTYPRKTATPFPAWSLPNRSPSVNTERCTSAISSSIVAEGTPPCSEKERGIYDAKHLFELILENDIQIRMCFL